MPSFADSVSTSSSVKEKINGSAISPKSKNLKSISSDDDDDNVPWAERLQNSSASNNKNKKVYIFKYYRSVRY